MMERDLRGEEAPAKCDPGGSTLRALVARGRTLAPHGSAAPPLGSRAKSVYQAIEPNAACSLPPRCDRGKPTLWWVGFRTPGRYCLCSLLIRNPPFRRYGSTMQYATPKVSRPPYSPGAGMLPISPQVGRRLLWPLTCGEPFPGRMRPPLSEDSLTLTPAPSSV
jgi:hypothetical protein